MKVRTEAALIIGNRERLDAHTVYEGNLKDFPKDIQDLVKKRSTCIVVLEKDVKPAKGKAVKKDPAQISTATPVERPIEQKPKAEQKPTPRKKPKAEQKPIPRKKLKKKVA